MGRTRQLFITPTGGRAFIDTPDEHRYKLSTALGPGWRLATRRERVWYELTAPRFSWLSLVSILILSNMIYNWLNP